MRTIASECAYECVPIIGPLVPSLHRYVSAVGPVRHGGSDRITVGTLLYSAYTLVPRLRFSRRYLLFLSFDVADLGVAELRELITSRELEVRVDPERFELATFANAHAKCETHHSWGRIVVRVTAEEAAWNSPVLAEVLRGTAPM